MLGNGHGDIVDLVKLAQSFRRLANCSLAVSWLENLPCQVAVLHARNACIALALYFQTPWIDEELLGIVKAVNWASGLYYDLDGKRRDVPLEGGIKKIEIK